MLAGPHPRSLSLGAARLARAAGLPSSCNFRHTLAGEPAQFPQRELRLRARACDFAEGLQPRSIRTAACSSTLHASVDTCRDKPGPDACRSTNRHDVVHRGHARRCAPPGVGVESLVVHRCSNSGAGGGASETRAAAIAGLAFRRHWQPGFRPRYRSVQANQSPEADRAFRHPRRTRCSKASPGTRTTWMQRDSGSARAHKRRREPFTCAVGRCGRWLEPRKTPSCFRCWSLRWRTTQISDSKRPAERRAKRCSPRRGRGCVDQ